MRFIIMPRGGGGEEGGGCQLLKSVTETQPTLACM